MPNRAKPSFPRLNRSHPLAQGLVFDAPYFEGSGVPNEIVSNAAASITGAGITWANGKYGAMLNGNGTNGLVTHVLRDSQKNLTKVTFEIPVIRTNTGGGGYGMVFRNEGSAAAKYLFNNDNGGGGLGMTFQGTFSTTTGVWSVPYPTLGVWTHYLITYDSALTTNQPLIYIDGKAAIVTQRTAPVGSIKTTNSDQNLYVGDDPTQVTGWNGSIAYIRMWNRLLSEQEAAQLYADQFQIYRKKSWLLTSAVSAATAFTLTGPSSGTQNSGSSNFTVTPNGTYTGTVTISYSGTGSSGLSPTVLTFSDATPQTFTITPTVVGQVTLTPTNNGSLSNPTNLTYTVNAASSSSPIPGSGQPGMISMGHWKQVRRGKDLWWVWEE